MPELSPNSLTVSSTEFVTENLIYPKSEAVMPAVDALSVLMDVPYIVRILVSLGVILALNRWVRNLGVSVVVGTVLLMVWSGHSVSSATRVLHGFLGSANTWFLLLVVFLVIWLSMQLAEAGVMSEMVGAVRRRLPRHGAMAVLPAVIGMLPMPGGAAFSAPMVGECDDGERVYPLLKSKTNYWFRHVWEYWWPLYPGVLLAIEKTGLAVWEFMLLQLPMSFMSIGVGSAFLLRKIKRTDTAEAASGQGDEPTGDENESRTSGRDPMELVRLASPVIIVIAVYAIIRVMFPLVYETNKYLPMVTGLVVAIFGLQRGRPLSRESWKRIIFSRKAGVLALLVFLIGIYGAFIESRLPGGSMLMTEVKAELQTWGIPTVLMLVLLPFFSGLATGLAVGFVGTSFPIVMTLLGQDPAAGTLLAGTVLAFGCGYMGMILSPVHICLIVTNEHFQTRVVRSLAGLVVPSSVMGLLVLLYSLLIYLMF